VPESRQNPNLWIIYSDKIAWEKQQTARMKYKGWGMNCRTWKKLRLGSKMNPVRMVLLKICTKIDLTIMLSRYIITAPAMIMQAFKLKMLSN
jgi:hypothetical protein